MKAFGRRNRNTMRDLFFLVLFSPERFPLQQVIHASAKVQMDGIVT